jgi:hypothetical protein
VWRAARKPNGAPSCQSGHLRTYALEGGQLVDGLVFAPVSCPVSAGPPAGDPTQAAYEGGGRQQSASASAQCAIHVEADRLRSPRLLAPIASHALLECTGAPMLRT